MISRVPFPNGRSGVIRLAIAGNPEHDGHLSPWQEAVGHEIIPDTRERNIKHWPRAWKVTLILRTNPNWDDLYDQLA